MTAQAILPQGWSRPSGYAHGVVARGRVLALAGQVGRANGDGALAAGFVPQFAQALDNVLAVVAGAGGAPGDVVSLTVFVADRGAYLDARPALGAVWRQRFGRHYPAMALVVAGPIDPEAQVEIQGLAVLP